MSSNVTTKICVDSIRAQLPHILPHLGTSADAQANHWKRYHKSGRSGDAILRRFHATHLPLLADVTEQTNGDLTVHFLPMWEWNQSLYGIDEDAFDSDHYLNRDILSLVQQHVKPSMFAFAVGEDPDMGVYINLCPLEYWRREGHMWDSHLGAIVELMSLPFRMGEEMESVFSIEQPEPLSGEAVIQAMALGGFAVDNDFIRFVNEQAA